MPRSNWSREELIIAFNLYCKTPFGRIHIRNPHIIELARALGRSPSAVSWKLANFARLDPSLKRRNVSGASHGAKLEAIIWQEFSNDWDRLAFESEELLSRLSPSLASNYIFEDFPEGISRPTTVLARVNQSFFRSAVLAAYRCRCCISGLDVSSLLNASHIVPWRDDAANRTNPKNGLCLNVLHDKAFDRGLLTITTDYRVKVSPALPRTCTAEDLFFKYEGREISLPERFLPDPSFLEYHNRHVFQP